MAKEMQVETLNGKFGVLCDALKDFPTEGPVAEMAACLSLLAEAEKILRKKKVAMTAMLVQLARQKTLLP